MRSWSWRTCGSGRRPGDGLMLDDVVGRLLEPVDEAERDRRLGAALAELPADELFRRLKDESERLLFVDAHASLRVSDALVQGARLAGRPSQLALGLMATGDALRYLEIGRAHV